MKNLKYLLFLLPLDALAHAGHDGLPAASVAGVTLDSLFWVGLAGLSLAGVLAVVTKGAPRGSATDDD